MISWSKREVTATQNTKTMIIARGHKFEGIPNKIWHQTKIHMLHSAFCTMLVNVSFFVICLKTQRPQPVDNYILSVLPSKFRSPFKEWVFTLAWIICYFALKDTTALTILLYIQHIQSLQVPSVAVERTLQDQLEHFSVQHYIY